MVKQTEIGLSDGIEAFEAQMGPWGELWRSLPDSQPFQHPAWCRAWMTAKIRPGLPYIATVKKEDELVAIWPVWSDFSRSCSMGSGQSDWCMPLFPADALPWEKMSQVIPRVENGFVMDLGPFTQPVPQSQRVRGSNYLVGKSWSLGLAGGWNEQLEAFGKSLRQDLRGLDQCEVEISDSDSQSEALEDLIRLHRKRSSDRRRWSTFLGRDSLNFHRTLMREPGSEEIVRIVRVRHGGHLIAATYGLISPSGMHFYQSGIDPEFKSRSPGSLAIAGLMRSAIESGAPRFYFLRGLEPYKLRWKPDQTHEHWRWVSSGSEYESWIQAPVWKIIAKAEQWARRRMDKPGLQKASRDGDDSGQQ